MNYIENARFWCFKVLPLVYDESLSYYEVLCKVMKKLNELIGSLDTLPEEIKQIEAAIAQIEKWIEEFDTTVIQELVEKWINEHLASSIYVEIDDSGYFKIYVPEGWEDITFKTSGWDYYLEPPVDYGHLVLLY